MAHRTLIDQCRDAFRPIATFDLLYGDERKWMYSHDESGKIGETLGPA